MEHGKGKGLDVLEYEKLYQDYGRIGKCPVCGTLVIDVRYCPHCGQRLNMNLDKE